MTPHRFIVVVAFVVTSVPPLAAQDVPLPIRMAVACAPLATTSGSAPSDAPRIIGSQDTVVRLLYGTRDLVVIDSGTGHGLQLGQKFAVRARAQAGYRTKTALKPVVTKGWLTVVGVNERTAIGTVDFACDGVERGDSLEPWVEPVIPADVNRTDAGGELDFSSPVRVLFGEYAHSTVGGGDLVLADGGRAQELVPGERMAVYRDAHVDGVPLVAIGEAIVISVGDATSLVRLTRSRDAVMSGDLLIPRKR